MGHSPTPATSATASIFFELDRFERADDNRLVLTGRWYGVRGRRFVRPSLSLMSGEDKLRALADLEHKPWAAEEGEEWHAAFPCTAEDVAEVQLAVAPDIAVQLPDPGANGSSSRRLEVVSPPRPTRRAKPTRARRSPKPATPAPAAEPPSPSPAAPELADARRSLSELRQRVEQLQGELELAQAERYELKAAFNKRDATVQELRQARFEWEDGERNRTRTEQQHERELAQREAVLGERETALDKRCHALTDREAALGDRNRVLDQREAALSREGTSLNQRESKLSQRERELDQRDSKFSERDRALGEREQALAARPAGLRTVPVRPDPPADRPRSDWATWLQRGFAVVFLLVPIIAVLVLTKAL